MLGVRQKNRSKKELCLGVSAVVVIIFLVGFILFASTGGPEPQTRLQQRQTIQDAKAFAGRLERDKERLSGRIDAQKLKNEQLDEKLANLEIEFETLQMGFCSEQSTRLSECLDKMRSTTDAIKE
jgi:N-methylhydantoinase A/oxoprolinase/acetone carboxylase beta subunit